MGVLVVMEAMVECAVGAGPRPLTVVGTTIIGEMIAGNIMTTIPYAEIPSFSVCSILAAATMGAKTACVPAVAMWTPGAPTLLIGGMCALDNMSVLACAEGGAITVSFPGQVQVMAGE